jgi:hypothetical protein
MMLASFAAGLAVYLGWRYRTVSPLAVLLVGGLLTAGIRALIRPDQQWMHVERTLPGDRVVLGRIRVEDE